MNSPDVRPEILIAKIAEMPHSSPTVETFRHFANPGTYRVDIADLGDDQIYFAVGARPKGGLSQTMDLLLSLEPNGPKVGLLVAKREDGDQRFPRLQYETGWEHVTYDPTKHPNHAVYKFARTLRTEGTYDPTSMEGLWLVQVMQYFNLANTRYFVEQGINPDPKVLTHDQKEEEWAQASKRFLASLG